MINIFIILVIVLLAFCVFNFMIQSTSPLASNVRKDYINSYFSGFRMFLCKKNKLVFFPPKEIEINGIYYTLNLDVKSTILRHRSITGSGIFKNESFCTECLCRCSANSNDIMNLGMTFSQFRQMSDSELENRLRMLLTSEEAESLLKN